MAEWSPTHVQVTVLRAKNLIPKSKSGETNNAYVRIKLGKEHFETSVLEKSKAPEWNEECELTIKDLTESVVLSAYHRQKQALGTDYFLGRVELPLADLNFYDKPKDLWFPLRGKKTDSGKEEKYRGELQVRLNFSVQKLAASVPNLGGKKERSGTPIPKVKHHGSVMNMSSKITGFGSSLFSSRTRSQLKINETPKTQTDFTFQGEPAPKKQFQMSPDASPKNSLSARSAKQNGIDEFTFASSGESIKESDAPVSAVSHLAIASPVAKSSSFSDKMKSVFTSNSNPGSVGNLPRVSSRASQHDMPIADEPPKSAKSESTRKKKNNNGGATPVVDPGTPEMRRLPNELLRKYGHLEKDDLITKLDDVEKKNAEQQAEINRLSNYIEKLMLRVMDTAPNMLQIYPTNGVVSKRW